MGDEMKQKISCHVENCKYHRAPEECNLKEILVEDSSCDCDDKIHTRCDSFETEQPPK